VLRVTAVHLGFNLQAKTKIHLFSVYTAYGAVEMSKAKIENEKSLWLELWL